MTAEHFISLVLVVTACLGMAALIRMSASVRKMAEDDDAAASNDPFAGPEPCGYCGTALDPAVICKLCFVRIHQAGRDLPTGDHWR